MKQTLHKLLNSSIMYDLEGSIEDAMEYLGELAEKGATHLEVTYDDDGQFRLAAYVQRLETDEEEATRMEKESKYLTWTKRLRKQEYLKLKKEFENGPN